MKTLTFFIISLIVTLFGLVSVQAQDGSARSSINHVIDNYLDLKNALIKGNGEAAEKKASDLLSAVNAVPQRSMTAERFALWTKYETKLQFDSRHISEVNLIAHQREHFASLSKNLFTVLKGLKMNDKPLYYQYCVMKSNYFISETAKGKDPYMGMDNCSRVKETLPPGK